MVEDDYGNVVGFVLAAISGPVDCFTYALVIGGVCEAHTLPLSC